MREDNPLKKIKLNSTVDEQMERNHVSSLSSCGQTANTRKQMMIIKDSMQKLDPINTLNQVDEDLTKKISELNINDPTTVENEVDNYQQKIVEELVSFFNYNSKVTRKTI